MTHAQPRVLILIVDYNSGEHIHACLESLHRAGVPSAEAEVMVVDNASSDGSADAVRRAWPGVRVIENKENLGFAGGNNIGLAYCIEKGIDYAYLLNPDTEVEAGFLDELLAVAEGDRRIGAVQSKLLLFEDKHRLNTLGNKIHYIGVGFAGGYGEPDVKDAPVQDIAFASGACMLLRASALKDAGLFNEEFFLYLEDADLCWRMRLHGYRIVVAPRSVVYHKYEFARNKGKFYYLERNRLLMLLHNYRPTTLLVLSVPIVVMQIGFIVHSFLGGWWREEMRMWKYFGRPANWRKLLSTRREVQQSRRVADRDVVRGFVPTIEFKDIRSPVLTYVANPLLCAYWFLARRVI